MVVLMGPVLATGRASGRCVDELKLGKHVRTQWHGRPRGPWCSYGPAAVAQKRATCGTIGNPKWSIARVLL
jgi:hypothetical protein